MKIRENEEVKTQTHRNYSEFKLRQVIYSFEDLAESVVITAKDKEGKIINSKTFSPLFSNCHINLSFQDKGKKVVK